MSLEMHTHTHTHSHQKHSRTFMIVPPVTCFSRMRSEGFPFIVGVWGLDLCSRGVGRVVVVSSSSGRRRVVDFSPIWAVHTQCDTIISLKV